MSETLKKSKVSHVTPSHNTLVEVALLALLSFLWGASFTMIEIAIDTIPPATIVFGRLIIGAALLVLFALWNGVSFPRSVSRWRALLIQGILQSALPFTLISWGQKYIDSGLAGLLNTTPPLFVFLIGFFLLRDRHASVRHVIGILWVSWALSRYWAPLLWPVKVIQFWAVGCHGGQSELRSGRYLCEAVFGSISGSDRRMFLWLLRRF